MEVGSQIQIGGYYNNVSRKLFKVLLSVAIVLFCGISYVLYFVYNDYAALSTKKANLVAEFNKVNYEITKLAKANQIRKDNNELWSVLPGQRKSTMQVSDDKLSSLIVAIAAKHHLLNFAVSSVNNPQYGQVFNHHVGFGSFSVTPKNVTVVYDTTIEGNTLSFLEELNNLFPGQVVVKSFETKDGTTIINNNNIKLMLSGGLQPFVSVKLNFDWYILTK